MRALGAVVMLGLVIAVAGCSGGSTPPADNQPATLVPAEPSPAGTPMIVKDAAGNCSSTEASWTPSGTGIAVTTIITGPVTVQVNVDGANSVNQNATIGLLDTPYTVNVDGADVSKIKDVELYSIQTEDQPASFCVVPKA